MASGIAILAIGFLLGMRHATDPDHVIAISTIITRERSVLKAGAVGALWGVGHSVTIFAVGAAIILFGMAIPARVGLTMEFSVGLMLILLGVLNLTGAMKWMRENFSPAHPTVTGEHAHVHGHGRRLHFHWHSHRRESEHHSASFAPPRALARLLSALGGYRALRPLLIGIVHGLAGSAAVALLVLSTIRDPRWAVLYLLIFGVGTIAGMMFITAAMALPLSFVGNRFAGLTSGLVTTSGLVSVAFGLFICYHIGFVQGLFGDHPNWTPG
jgi:high-affinity nickel-transport protein